MANTNKTISETTQNATPSTLIPFQEALHSLEAASKCLVDTQTIAVPQALSRILAENIIAPIDIPPAPNSAMDGYAVNSKDWQPEQAMMISQRIAAGAIAQPLAPNTCARIFTGAEIPAGADAVIMQENAKETNNQVTFTQAPKPQENIRPQGQDIHQGQIVFQQGQQLTPQHIGMLANIGLTHITVYKKLRVGILTTGDELVTAGTPLQQGQIYNSNGPMLCALMQKWGYEISAYQHVMDDYDSTLQALHNMAKTSDFILSSGGVSVGEEDHIKSVIQANGTLSLWKIAMKPGKPLLYAELFNTPLLGLPGNPSSTLVTGHFFARLALSVSAGQKANLPESFLVLAGFERKKTLKRDEFLRVNLTDNIAMPHAQQSSGALHAACTCDGYLHIPANTAIEKGKQFAYFPFYSF